MIEKPSSVARTWN